MVNLVAGMIPMLHGVMKKAGVVREAVEVEAGTVINMWVPVPEQSKKKPVVVLVHGFAGDGTVTWLFQVRSLTNKYAVYVPDLLFFGASTTDRPERSPGFQAECLAKGLRKLGVERCTLVGFSYGGIVAFKMAQLHPDLVEALVVTGGLTALTESLSRHTLHRLGFSSFPELLLPESVKGCKALLRFGMHKKLYLPNRLYKDFLQTMFINTKERAGLLEDLVVQDTPIPKFPQRIYLLWGEQDQIFTQELAQNMKEELGDKATYEGIKRAGHLVHIERPFVYNKCLKHFLASLPQHAPTNSL